MIFDTVDRLEDYVGTVPQLMTVAQAMDHDDIYNLERGKYKTPDSKVSYIVSEYNTADCDRPFEFHAKTTYVHIVLKGSELMSTTWRELKDQVLTFDGKTDTGFFTAEPLSVIQAAVGRFAVFLPGEPFKTGLAVGESSLVKKVVFEIKED